MAGGLTVESRFTDGELAIARNMAMPVNAALVNLCPPASEPMGAQGSHGGCPVDNEREQK